jgi:hypothetical protein
VNHLKQLKQKRSTETALATSSDGIQAREEKIWAFEWVSVPPQEGLNGRIAQLEKRTNGKISPSPKHKRMNNYKPQNKYFWAQS